MKLWWLAGVGLASLALAMLYQDYNADVAMAQRHLSALERAGDDCQAIARKAAMDLPEALPFQKLEKAARTARVFEVCMHDQGYAENPAWVTFAQPIAQQFATAQNVSLDEAYETLRREHMQTFNFPETQPSYWVPNRRS